MRVLSRLWPVIALAMFVWLGLLTGDGELGFIIPMVGNMLVLLSYLFLYLIGSRAVAGHPIVVSLLLGASHAIDIPIGAIAWEFGADDSTFTEAQAQLLKDHCAMMGSVALLVLAVLTWHLLTWGRPKPSEGADE